MADAVRSSIDEKYFVTVGQITVAWTFIEIAIAGITSILFNFSKDNPKNKVIGGGFSGDVEYVRFWLDTFPIEENIKQEIIKVIDQASSLSDVRHQFVHGVLDNVTTHDGQLLKFSRLRKRKGIYRDEKSDFEIGKLVETIESMTQLGEQAADLCLKILSLKR